MKNKRSLILLLLLLIGLSACGNDAVLTNSSESDSVVIDPTPVPANTAAPAPGSLSTPQAEEPPSAAEDEWQEALAAYMREENEIFHETWSDTFEARNVFWLYDVDKNGIPELFYGWQDTRVSAFQNGKMEYLGEIWMTTAYVPNDNSTNGIWAYGIGNGSLPAWDCSFISLQNGVLTQEHVESFDEIERSIFDGAVKELNYYQVTEDNIQNLSLIYNESLKIEIPDSTAVQNTEARQNYNLIPLYEDFLKGKVNAVADTETVTNAPAPVFSVKDIMRGIKDRYAVFDMNNDGTEELLFNSDTTIGAGAIYIFSHHNDELFLWWSDKYLTWSGYSQILTNGDVLRISSIGVPERTNYNYLVLNENGTEKENVSFAEYDSDLDGTFEDFYFESEGDLSQEEWKQKTEPYLSVSEIEWTDYIAETPPADNIEDAELLPAQDSGDEREAYRSILLGDFTLIDDDYYKSYMEYLYNRDTQDGVNKWIYIVMDFNKDSCGELFIRFGFDTYESALFRYADGNVKGVYLDDIEGNDYAQPLKDGKILHTYDYWIAPNKTVYEFDSNFNQVNKNEYISLTIDDYNDFKERYGNILELFPSVTQDGVYYFQELDGKQITLSKEEWKQAQDNINEQIIPDGEFEECAALGMN